MSLQKWPYWQKIAQSGHPAFPARHSYLFTFDIDIHGLKFGNSESIIGAMLRSFFWLGSPARGFSTVWLEGRPPPISIIMSLTNS
jgi:hypothetical protein